MILKCNLVCGKRNWTWVICTVLGYCAALSGSYVPTFRNNVSFPSSSVIWRWDRQIVLKRQYRTTTQRCVISQKSAVLVSIAAEAWNHTWTWVPSTECLFCRQLYRLESLNTPNNPWQLPHSGTWQKGHFILGYNGGKRFLGSIRTDVWVTSEERSRAA
jgi:hypothetical protein